MRAAIDVQNLLVAKTGIGHYANNLVRNLALLPVEGTIEAFYFSSGRSKNRLGLAGGSVTERAITFPPGRLVQFLWKRFSFPKVDMFLRNADVFHFPNFVSRPVRAAKVVVTIPDLSFMRFPQFTEPKNLAFLRRHVPLSIERADKIIAISEFTRKEIAAFFPAAKDKVTVTPLGVSPDFSPRRDREEQERIQRKYGLPEEYILFVGTLEPRKNLMSLLKAFELFREESTEHEPIRLVVAGMKGWLYDRTMTHIRKMPPGMDPIMTGYVEDNDLPSLYSFAKMAVVPSFYEGFGLPCLEAMACGTPLICSNTSSLPEVVGDAAIQVSPTDSGEIAETMAALVADRALADKLSEKGRERAREFTWRRCAEATYRVYECAVRGRGSD